MSTDKLFSIQFLEERGGGHIANNTAHLLAALRLNFHVKWLLAIECVHSMTKLLNMYSN